MSRKAVWKITFTKPRQGIEHEQVMAHNLNGAIILSMVYRLELGQLYQKISKIQRMNEQTGEWTDEEIPDSIQIFKA